MQGRSVAWIFAMGMAVSACASATNGARPSPFPQPAAPPAIYPAPLTSSVNSFSTSSFIAAAQKLSGVRYQIGGSSPSTGFDCSGYVRYVFGLFRIQVPRTVAEQFRAGKPATSKAIRPGDLLFFRANGSTGSTVSHVALAISADEFIHAPGESGSVRTEKLSSPYWHARFVGARRIL